MSRSFALMVLVVLAAVSVSAAGDEGEWIPLFNGRDLSGWTVKVAKHPLGVNYADTFRVEDGAIKAAYDRYDRFDQQFAHLYSNVAYSHYVLRLEYRFDGEMVPDAPEWCALNSGVMLHTQSPLSLELGQLWPVSVEFQFLAIGTKAGRQTGNVCTPGTHVMVNGELTTAHIIDAQSQLYPVGEWIPIEVEVHGDELIIHRVRGVEVLRYTQPQLDPADRDAQRLLAAGANWRLSSGHIALQAEAQPVAFRNIRIRPLQR